MNFDFHMHSVYSDGSSTVEEIFKKANSIDLEAIAVTDHDTVLGIEEVDKFSRSYNIPFVPGIEFTAFEEGMKFHVLGYGIDFKSDELINYSLDILNKLNKKSKEQIDLMHRNGIDIPEEEFFAEGQGGPLYRAKLLKVLSRHGYLLEEDIMNSLGKFFGKDAPYYVEDGFKYNDFSQTVRLIKENGGIVVLAHPGKVKKKNEKLYYEVLNSGLLDGVEVYHISNNMDVREELTELANKKDIMITGGSDYHGDYNKHKTAIAGIDIPAEVYYNLEPYFKNKI